MKNRYTATEMIKLIAMCTLCMCMLFGVVAMSFTPTNEHNIQLRLRFIDLQMVLIGGILTEFNSIVNVVKKAAKPSGKESAGVE